MRRWILSHFNMVLHAGILILTAVLLGILSWGLIENNLVAAMIAGAGLALDIVLGGTSLLIPDDLRSQAMERTLRVASGTLARMADGLTQDSCLAVCQLLLPETNAAAIAMTNATHTLAYVGSDVAGYKTGSPNSQPTLDVLASKRMQTFSALDRDEQTVIEKDHNQLAFSTEMPPYPSGIIAPLIVGDKPMGTLKLYYRHGRDIDRTQLAIARGFAELLSAQLSSYELDRQAELTARAEVKALQAQINPHFLFNTLNTIAALIRIDPTRAREVLREFSSFYRHTLDSSSRTLIPLSEELEQTRRYLTIEKARFGEDRIIETETVEAGCESLMVPGFIVQPIVENAVRHGMKDEGPLHIDIQVVHDGDKILLAVADDGNGMDEEAAQHLQETTNQGVALSTAITSHEGTGNTSKTPHPSKGAGVALKNVAERLELFFGPGSGVEIVSREGEGTCVTLTLAQPKQEIAR